MANNIIKPDRLSFSAFHIFLGFRETDAVIANGSAFLYRHSGRFYLITNWHNVTGKDPFTKQYLSRKGAIPDVLVTFFRGKDDLRITTKEIISLYSDTDNTIPVWLEHPTHGSDIDVVAIPLPAGFSEKYHMAPLNDFEFNNHKPEVADEVYILGFPFDELQILAMPIWKKGSIASEPDINQKLLPLLYVDTATRPGLSGSPVIFQRSGIHGLVDGAMTGETIIGTIRGFLGIYSGRLGPEQEFAQLGFVWKRQAIEELFKN